MTEKGPEESFQGNGNDLKLDGWIHNLINLTTIIELHIENE